MDTLSVAKGRKGSAAFVVLGFVLLLTIALRVWGVSFSLPRVYHPDEPKIVNRAVQMVNAGDPNPRWYVYPSLYMYVQATVVAAVDGFSDTQTDPLAQKGRRYLAGRLTTCLFGTLTVLFVFLTARLLWGDSAGMGAAVVMALCFLHVQCSRYITTDVPSGLFAAVCLWASVRATTSERKGWFMFAGAAAGFAASTKYNAGMCLLQPLGMWCTKLRRFRSLVSWTPVLIAGCSAVAFLVMMPWIMSDTGTVVDDILSEMRHYQGGHDGAEGGAWSYYPTYLWSTGLTPGPTLLILAGLALAALRDRRRLLGLFVFPLLYFVLLGSMRVRFARNLMPILPGLAIFGGYAIYVAHERLRALAGHRPYRVLAWVLASTVGATIFAIPVLRIVQHARTILLPDTRTVVAKWIDENFESGTTFCMERYTPPVNAKRFKTLRERNLYYFADKDNKETNYKQCDYMVASSAAYQRYLDAAERYPKESRFYIRLFSLWELVAEFSKRPGESTGPTIRILRVPK